MNDRSASLGCGSLIVIALIVLFLGNAKSEEILTEVQGLRAEVQTLGAEVETLRAGLDTEALIELRAEVRALRAELERR